MEQSRKAPNYNSLYLLGTAYFVGTDGQKQLLLDTRAEKSHTADLGYDPETRVAYLPTFFKNTVAAYELK